MKTLESPNADMRFAHLTLRLSLADIAQFYSAVLAQRQDPASIVASLVRDWSRKHQSGVQAEVGL